MEGKAVTIKCESNGLPDPSYTIWGHCMKLSDNNTYIIKKVQTCDAGNYSCIATNNLGSNSAFAHLKVGKMRSWTFLAMLVFVATQNEPMNGTRNMSMHVSAKGIMHRYILVSKVKI